ncbi:MAG: lmo0937 family membrane protein [Ethanoligenens sp.]|uniref:lmo0937 family membrane protein n=1 Tax=Ethanoligenens sp. TaxID=2099655 RepID=UPI0039EB069F
MLWIVAGVLLVLWLVGILAAYTLGGLVHLLLIAALILIIVKIIQSIRKNVTRHDEPMK